LAQYPPIEMRHDEDDARLQEGIYPVCGMKVDADSMLLMPVNR
jgi:hypothetical protein